MSCLGLACLTAAGCAPDLNWREARLSEPGATQLFPCKPVRQQRQVELAGRKRLLVLHVCDAGGSTWAQAIVEADDEADAERVGAALAAALQDNLQLQAPQGSGSPMGRLLWHQGQAPDGRMLQVAGLVTKRGRRVFQVTAMGDRLTQDDAKVFIDSVQAGR